MAYRAEIEIGVKGAKQLKDFRASLENTNDVLRKINEQNDVFGKPLQSLKIYRDNLKLAAESLENVKAGIKGEKDAVRDYLRAASELNAFKERQNRLLDEEANKLGLVTQKLKEYNAAAAPSRQVGSMAGAYLRPSESRLRGQTSAINPQAQIKAAAEEQVRQEKRIRAANNETIRVLERRAQIEQKIADVRSARIARERSTFLQGASGAQQLGPLAGPGSLGFPVALPGLSKAESKGLQIAKQKLEIIERTVRRRQELVGLAGNLQRLELRAQVAAADANRQAEREVQTQKTLNEAKERELALEKLIRQERVKQSVARRKRIIADAKESRRRRKDAIGSGIIGGAFPLLFGQGAGAAVGGALGGFGGGLLGGQFGFGLSLVGTQLGTIFDQAIADALETSKALTSTAGALEFVREKALFTKKENEELAAKLEEQGDVAGLSALLTQELASSIGNEGVNALIDLGTETSELTKLWDELTLQLQALIAGPLSDFISLIGDLLGEQVAFNKLSRLQEDLAGTDAGKRLNAAVAELKAPSTIELADGTRIEDPFAFTDSFTGAAATKLFKDFEEFRPESKRNIPITTKDRLSLTGKDSGSDKAAREAARIQERIAKLRLERQALEEISVFKDKIAAAEAGRDKVLARTLKGEQIVAKIQQDGLKQLVGKTDQLEINEIKLTTQARINAADRDTERDKNEILRQRNELFTNTLTGLQSQLAIATATTREEAEQLRLREEMDNLRNNNDFTDGQLQQIELMKQSLIEAQQPLNAFITQSTQALNDFEQVAVTVSQGIGDAFGAAMTTGLSEVVAGTKSAEEVFADFLRNIANVLLQAAAQMIATYIAIGIARTFAGVPASGSGSSDSFAGVPNSVLDSVIGARANGGPVASGNPYIVGERGPELFVPRSNGRVVPNGRFGGGGGGDTNVVVNVDAKGSSTQGNEPNAKALGAAIGAAVQSEIIKQKRPGGLLA